jgi:hypothetical protein
MSLTESRTAIILQKLFESCVKVFKTDSMSLFFTEIVEIWFSAVVAISLELAKLFEEVSSSFNS